jgi:hypothetical protein
LGFNTPFITHWLLQDLELLSSGVRGYGHALRYVKMTKDMALEQLLGFEIDFGLLACLRS